MSTVKCVIFLVLLISDRQTDRQIDKQPNCPFLTLVVYKLRIFLTIKCGQNILLAYLWKHAFSWIIDVLFNWNFVNDQVFNLQCLVFWKEIFFTYCNQNKTKEYDPQRVIIICSKFDCSKNLLDTILLLLDTIQAIIIFFVLNMDFERLIANSLYFIFFQLCWL